MGNHMPMSELATALSLAQGEFEAASKDKTNPAFKSKYADLSSCLEAVRAGLIKHGLVVVQTTRPEGEGGSVLLVTTLYHKSGQWISSELPIVADWNRPQAVGSAITYARRYSLCALLQISQEDDDGEAAMGRPSQPPPRRDQPPQEPSPRQPYQRPQEPAGRTQGYGRTTAADRIADNATPQPRRSNAAPARATTADGEEIPF